ncbi:MAG TPA: hypothetical protein VFG83_15645 [Kofleriaceae bacterium]|nr:hypothetical protein [Kofleriaceae bacterium]
MQLMPTATAAEQRLGFLAGEIAVPDDFDRLGQEYIEELFKAPLEPPSPPDRSED